MLRSIPAKGAAGTGVSLIKFGAIISAIAGIFDTAQAFAAAKRVLAAGDNRAGAIYIGAGFGFTVSTGVFVYAVFKPLILGPLGLAVMLALTAYAISKWAEGNESVALSDGRDAAALAKLMRSQPYSGAARNMRILRLQSLMRRPWVFARRLTSSPIGQSIRLRPG